MKKKIDEEMIDKAYKFCKDQFIDEASFKKYWEENYAKFTEEFAALCSNKKSKPAEKKKGEA